MRVMVAQKAAASRQHTESRPRPAERFPYAMICELNEGSVSRSADRLRSSGDGRERRGQRHRETTMGKYLLHDEYTPQELAGGRS